MMVKIGREAGEIVFEDEFAEELGVPHLDQGIPRQGNRAKDKDAWQPNRPHDEPQFPRGQREHEDNRRREEGCDRTLR